MKEEQIKQNADVYAMRVAESHIIEQRPFYVAAFNGFMSGAHSRDEEIEKLKDRLRFADESIADADKWIAKYKLDIANLEAKLEQLRNPWISVEERLPEEPLTICAVWLKEDDLVPHISLYDSGRFLLLPVDVTVTHWMPIPELKKGE